MTGGGQAVSAASGEAKGWRGHPAGLAPLFFTELWERFSYYGMRALLTLFMVAPAAAGGLGLDVGEAARIYGNYTMAVYMLAIPGGYIADAFLGARRSVLWGGATIATGHFLLAVPARWSFFAGLLLIALGTGLLKPNISALVGGLYAKDDERRDAGFSLFYLGINLGAFLAPLVTGFLAQSQDVKDRLSALGLDPNASWHLGFGAAGIGMTLGLAVFVRHMHALPEPERSAHLAGEREAGPRLVYVLGATGALIALAWLSDRPGWLWLRLMFVAAPVAAAVVFARSPDPERRRLAAIAVFFLASMTFWALFEQAGLSVALFCDELTRNEIAGIAFPSAWFQALNPLFVIALAPVLAALWTRMGARQPSSPAKFVAGLMLLAASFLVMVPAAKLTAEGRVSPLWIVALFFLQTVGELMVSPVGLSLITRLAPPGLVGVMLGVWFLGASWGNKLAGIIGESFSAKDPAGLAAFFSAEAALAAAAAILLLLLVPWLRKLMGEVR
jgi:POT family proton-dependent oligopeptide transporter